MRLLLILCLSLSFCTTAFGQAAPAPGLVLKDLSGRTLRLADYKGKVLLINFWATWCPPCLAEIPELVKLQAEHGGQGLQIIGITYPPQQRREVRRMVRQLQINYPVVLGTKKTKALFLDSENLPVTIVIDRAGNIVERIEGILLPEEIEQKIKPLLY